MNDLTSFELEVFRRRKIKHLQQLLNYYSESDISQDLEANKIKFEDVQYTYTLCEKHVYFSHNDQRKCINCGSVELKPITIELPCEIISKILRLDSNLYEASRCLSKEVREYSLLDIYDHELTNMLSPGSFFDGTSYLVNVYIHDDEYVCSIGNRKKFKGIVLYRSYDGTGDHMKQEVYTTIGPDVRLKYWNYKRDTIITAYDIYHIETELRFIIEEIFQITVNESKLNALLQATLNEYNKRFKLYPLCNALAKNPLYLQEKGNIEKALKEEDQPFFSDEPSKAHIQPFGCYRGFSW